MFRVIAVQLSTYVCVFNREFNSLIESLTFVEDIIDKCEYQMRIAITYRVNSDHSISLFDLQMNSSYTTIINTAWIKFNTTSTRYEPRDMHVHITANDEKYFLKIQSAMIEKTKLLNIMDAV